MTVFLPNTGQALVESSGHPSGPYRRWMVAITDWANRASSSTTTTVVEPAPFVVNGSGSVTADGSVAGGEFVVALVGDKDSPPPNSFYGVTTAGEKGFVPVYDALAEGQGIAIRDSGYIVVDTVGTPDDLPLTGNAGEAVRVTESEPGIYAWDGAAFTLDPAATGVVNVALAPLADSGTGTSLKKIVRDAYGRVSATEDADASDVPYDNTTSGLSATNVQEAIDALVVAPAAGSWVLVSKASDESRTSNSAPSDDAELYFDCVSGKTYIVRLQVHFRIANGAMDFQYGANYSGTTSFSRRKFSHSDPGKPDGTSLEYSGYGSGFSGSAPIGTVASNGQCSMELAFTTTSTGRFSFRWAQLNSDPGAATVYAGSYLEYTVAT